MCQSVCTSPLRQASLDLGSCSITGEDSTCLQRVSNIYNGDDNVIIQISLRQKQIVTWLWRHVPTEIVMTLKTKMPTFGGCWWRWRCWMFSLCKSYILYARFVVFCCGSVWTDISHTYSSQLLHWHSGIKRPGRILWVNRSYEWLRPGPRLNIKTVLSTYCDFHVKDKTAVRTSYL